MKPTLLLLATCLVAAPAFADADRCNENLQKLETETGNPTDHTSANEAKMFIEQAREAQARGDTNACVTASERALKTLDQSYRQGNGSGSGPGAGSGNAN